MSVNYIVEVDCDKSSKDIYIKNSCNENVGEFTDRSTGATFKLDDHDWKTLIAGHTYSVQYCGVPWVGRGAMSFSYDKYTGWEVFVDSGTAHIVDMSPPHNVHPGGKLKSSVTVALSDGENNHPGLQFN